MMTDGSDNLAPAPRPAGDRLLMLLKTRGPQTAAALGTALGITAEAARQQLGKLAAEGLVVAAAEPRGVGRPAWVWSLTAAGHARFPDAHAELTVQLLRTIRSELGERALDRLIAARASEAHTNYAAALAGTADLGERVARLAELRSREGYMAEWRAEGDGYLLVENHCPICAAAAACQGFCRAELDLFQRALGEDVSVERTEHIIAGDRRCAYRITPKRRSAAASAGDTGGSPGKRKKRRLP
jgi:predicted ArsR family transcriptional regulator